MVLFHYSVVFFLAGLDGMGLRSGITEAQRSHAHKAVGEVQLFHDLLSFGRFKHLVLAVYPT